MYIRKALTIIIFIFALVFAATPFAFATESSRDGTDLFPADFDKEYVCKSIAKVLAETYLNEDGIELSPSAIDLSKAYKLYEGANITDIKTDRFDKFCENLNMGVVYYLVPVTVKQTVYTVTTQLIKPLSKSDAVGLTEDELSDYNKDVGKWAAVGVAKYDKETPFKDYYGAASKASGISESKPILVIGMPYFGSIVAIYSDDKGGIGKLVPTVPEMADYESLGLKDTKKAITYDYSDIAARIMKAPKTDANSPTVFSGASLSDGAIAESHGRIIAVCVVAGTVALIAIVVAIRFRRRKAVQGNAD